MIFSVIGAGAVRKGYGGSKIKGHPVWFLVHRISMIASFVLTNIGFILIFVALKGWSPSAGVHGIIGCIVVGLTVINFTLGMVRPAPGKA